MVEVDVRRRGAGRYAPGWVDDLTDAIERLPGPPWLVYVLAFAALLVVSNAAAWIDGRVVPGTIDPYLSSLAVYPIAGLAAMHVLDLEAAAALRRLRPALPVGDDEIDAVEYQLTTMPATATVVASLIGVLFAVGYVVLGSAVPIRAHGTAVLVVDAAIALVGFPILAVFFFHTLRQLRIVSRIQDSAVIDVFQLDPLLAFSRVTAFSGLVILGLAYLSAATDPSTFVLTNPTLLAFVVAAIVVAIAAFVVPMYGIHQRIAAAKSRAAADANAHLRAALDDLNRRAAARDLSDADALNKHIASLVSQRDLIERLRTWPWQPGTLRGFVTAVVLPIALWVVFRMLDRLIG